MNYILVESIFCAELELECSFIIYKVQRFNVTTYQLLLFYFPNLFLHKGYTHGHPTAH